MRYNTYGPLSGRVEQSVGLCVYLYGKQKLVIVSDCAYVYDVVTVVHFFRIFLAFFYFLSLTVMLSSVVE